MSNKIKVIICILSAALIFSLLYMYKSNQSLADQIKTNDDLREKITQIEKLKTNIIDMTITANYLLLTDNDSYRISYDRSYNTALSNLDELYNSEYISKDDKKSLEDGLNEFNESLYENLTAENDEKKNLSADRQHIILNLSDIETMLIEGTSDTLYNSIEKSKSSSGTAMNIVDNQNNLLQIIGGFISMILLSPLYFFKKNPAIITDAIKSFISNLIKKTHSQSESKDSKTQKPTSKCDEEMIQCVNTGLVKNLETMLSERELMISTLKIVYSHNEYMKKEWLISKKSLDSIEHDLLDL